MFDEHRVLTGQNSTTTSHNYFYSPDTTVTRQRFNIEVEEGTDTGSRTFFKGCHVSQAVDESGRTEDAFGGEKERRE